MSQIVSCPNCSCVFEVDDLFEKCESIVEKLTHGYRTGRGTRSIDVIGADGTTYQVKYSKRKKKNSGWIWDITSNHMEADFFVLFGFIKSEMFIFLLPYSIVVKNYGTRLGGDNHHDKYLSVGNSYKHWIWDYRVLPENFMIHVSMLKDTEQLAMQFTNGLC